jgi:hypothetical protein
MSIRPITSTDSCSEIARFESLETRALFSAAYSFDPIAFLNAPTPGPAGDTFSAAGGFEPAGINNAGQVAFASYINSKGQPAGEGVYRAANDEITQLIRQGDPAPGGLTFGGFGTFSPGSINNKGDVVINFGRDPATATLGVNAALYKSNASTGKLTGVVVPGVTTSPTGGKFKGVGFHAAINDSGLIAFPGVVSAGIGPGKLGGLGIGVFQIDLFGHVSRIAAPGDKAPGGKIFDFAQNPSINAQGDVAFGAHVKSDPILTLGNTTFPATPNSIFAAESIYVRQRSTGKIRSIAHQGAAIPVSAGGGTYDYAFGPAINNKGQVAFIGAVRQKSNLADPSKDPFGVFFDDRGKTVAVARPGTAMPGGGKFVSASFFVSNMGINNNGDVVFNCTLNTGQQGIYSWHAGKLTLIAKTGTVIPGIGTVDKLDFAAGQPSGGALTNDRGQILFGATFKEGGGALLVANPAKPIALAFNTTTSIRTATAEAIFTKQRKDLAEILM